MNNIRISVDLTKVDGARLIKADAPSGKPEFYVAIPVSSLFMPKDSKSVHLTCTMIPCPNALYGDFMLKKYINGTTYANMSQEEREAVPIIGKGTYIKPKLDKAQAQSFAKTNVVSVSIDQLQEAGLGQQLEPAASPAEIPATNPGQSEGIATSPNAHFPAGSGTDNATKLYLVLPDESWMEFPSFNDAAAYAVDNGPTNCLIKVIKGNTLVQQYRYDDFYQKWEKDM